MRSQSIDVGIMRPCGSLAKIGGPAEIGAVGRRSSIVVGTRYNAARQSVDITAWRGRRQSVDAGALRGRRQSHVDVGGHRNLSYDAWMRLVRVSNHDKFCIALNLQV